MVSPHMAAPRMVVPQMVEDSKEVLTYAAETGRMPWISSSKNDKIDDRSRRASICGSMEPKTWMVSRNTAPIRVDVLRDVLVSKMTEYSLFEASRQANYVLFVIHHMIDGLVTFYASGANPGFHVSFRPIIRFVNDGFMHSDIFPLDTPDLLERLLDLYIPVWYAVQDVVAAPGEAERIAVLPDSLRSKLFNNVILRRIEYGQEDFFNDKMEALFGFRVEGNRMVAFQAKLGQKTKPGQKLFSGLDLISAGHASVLRPPRKVKGLMIPDGVQCEQVATEASNILDNCPICGDEIDDRLLDISNPVPDQHCNGDGC